jgi:hypothetical protein
MFMYYSDLGPLRSPQKVADEFKCSRRHIYAVMKKYAWKDRIAEYSQEEARQKSFRQAEIMSDFLERKAQYYLDMLDRLLQLGQSVTTASHEITLEKIGIDEFLIKANRLSNVDIKIVRLIERIEQKLKTAISGITPENIIEKETEDIDQLAQEDESQIDQLAHEINTHINPTKLSFAQKDRLEYIQHQHQVYATPKIGKQTTPDIDIDMNKYERHHRPPQLIRHKTA